MDKMREEFSKYCQIWRYNEEVDENDFFVNATTQRAWDVWVTAWQAGCQALVVQLPVEIDATHEDCQHSEYAYLADSVKSALDNAGIKWIE